MDLLDEFFSGIYSWMQDLAGSFPPPIKITSSQRTPVVSIDYTIWIEHRDHFKHEVLSQEFGLIIVWVS